MSTDAPDPAPAAVAATEYRRDLIRPTFFRRLKWRVETLAYVGVEGLLGLMPLVWLARFGRVVGGVAVLLLPGRRRVVARNLRIAFGEERSPEELHALVREVFRRSGANLLCSLRTAEMSERALARALVVRDEIVYRQALARGRGVVMVLAHMGNWEALAQWFPHLLSPGVAGATVYRPLNNPLMNARVAATRSRRGLGLFSKDDNPLGMAAFLRRGGVLGVLADQRAGVIGELVPFFGRLTSCTPIPAILARRTGAAIVGISLRTVGAGRWEAGFHAMEAGEPTTAGVMRLLERMVRESPADVFWLQDRWKVYRSTPHRPPGKTPRAAAVEPAKRRRALVWHAPGAAGPPVPPAPRPDDVDHELGLAQGAAAPLDLRWAASEAHRQAPGESFPAFLRRVDEARAQPLEYVVAAPGADPGLRRACRALGLGWVEADEGGR
jgi:KDO2-lipid IV(A) lauroyltransferase